ncbi:MAG: hypothetical protein ACXVZL_07980, partial [Gaiellaceae bacterium]
VTDGPREIMTRKCPTCGGDGIVYSEASAAIDVERRIRSLAAGSKSQAFRLEVAAPIASALVGSGARRLIELEALTKRRFFFEGKPNMHSDHFVVLAEGKLADLAPQAPVEEGVELTLELVEVDRHDAAAAVGKLDGLDVCVGEAAELVGKKTKIRVERVLDGIAYATLVRRAKTAPEPLTAEAEAEKPTRKPPARKTAGADASEVSEEGEELELGAETGEAQDEPTVAEAPVAEAELATDDAEATGEESAAAPGAPAKKKTRRGSRGGRNRKKPVGAAAGATAEGEPGEDSTADSGAEADEAPAEAKAPAVRTSTPRGGGRSVTIHVPSADFGRDRADDEAGTAQPAADGTEATENEPTEDGAAPAKKKTRRGSRGGRNRQKPAGARATAGATNGSQPAADTDLDGEPQAFAEAERAPDGRAGLVETSFEEPAPEPAPLSGPRPDPEPRADTEHEAEPEPAPETTEPEPAAVAARADDDGVTEDGDWGYVPMSEWGDDLNPSR